MRFFVKTNCDLGQILCLFNLESRPGRVFVFQPQAKLIFWLFLSPYLPTLKPKPLQFDTSVKFVVAFSNFEFVLNILFFLQDDYRDHHDSLPKKSILSIEHPDEPSRVVVFNSHARRRTEVVTVLINLSNVKVNKLCTVGI